MKECLTEWIEKRRRRLSNEERADRYYLHPKVTAGLEVVSGKAGKGSHNIRVDVCVAMGSPSVCRYRFLEVPAWEPSLR